jgi:hypothetical protein
MCVEVLTVKINIFWNVTPFSLVNISQRFAHSCHKSLHKMYKTNINKLVFYII